MIGRNRKKGRATEPRWGAHDEGVLWILLRQCYGGQDSQDAGRWSRMHTALPFGLLPSFPSFPGVPSQPSHSCLQAKFRTQNCSLERNSARASFQSGMGGSPASRSIIFSSLEFAGRGAGRGNSSVLHGTIF